MLLNKNQLFLKWSALTVFVSLIVGSISAFFLVSLDWVTNTRESNMLWVYLLPIGGFFSGWMYFRLGRGVEGDNNRVIAEMVVPKRKIHWKMTPLVLVGTLSSHLFGASAGREGTAVQMGAASADHVGDFFKLNQQERQIILRMGVAAGFSAVFGTPIAGFFFAFEMARDKIFAWKAFLLVAIAAFLGDMVCHLWQVEHTRYEISEVPILDIKSLSWTVMAGVLFGLTALLFNLLKKYFGAFFVKFIAYPPLRTAIGGLLVLIFVLTTGSTKFLGLGVPFIQEAFVVESNQLDFIIKLLLTAITLGAGFKGGEATPLFFIGATLGSMLFGWVPLPLSLLAGLGFIAVFAGATNSPLTCIAMGGELFGWEGLPYYLVVCFLAYYISGKTSVYAEQVKYINKYQWLKKANAKSKVN